METNYLCSQNVDVLKDTHKENIEKLKGLLDSEDVLPASGVTGDGLKVDDLFLLRYILSNKGMIEDCVQKIKDALEWRQENIELLKAVNNGGKHPLQDQMNEFLLTGDTGSLNGGEPVRVVRLGLSDCKGLMNKMSVEEVSTVLTFEKEKLFQKCDQQTRKTGRLIKSVTVIDFTGFSLFGSRFDKKVLTALGSSSKTSSFLYPQLQVKTVAVNTPSYYNMVHKLLAAVMPKSSMEKMVHCSGSKGSSKNAVAEETCPFSKAYGVGAAVPSFLGGHAEVPNSLLPLNERKKEPETSPLKYKQNQPPELEPIKENPAVEQFNKSLNVSPRSYAIVRVPVEYSDSTLSFEISVDSKHVKLGATVYPHREGGDDFGEPEPSPIEGTFSDIDSDDEMSSPDTIAISRKRSTSVDALNKNRSSKLRIKRRLRSPSESKRVRTRSDPQGHELFDSGSEDLPKEVQVYKKYVRFNQKSRSSEKSTARQAMVPIRVDSKDGIVKGKWSVPVKGLVVFKIDNSFSKLRSKRVALSVNVEPPAHIIEAMEAKTKTAVESISTTNPYPVPAHQKLIQCVEKFEKMFPMSGTLFALLFVISTQFFLLLYTN